MAAEATRAVLAKLGLSEKQARQLLKMPADRLKEVQQQLSQRPLGVAAPSGATLGFSPVVDGHYIPSHPFDPVAPAISANIPILVGTNKDETIFMFRGTPEVFSLDEAGLKNRLQAPLGEKTARVPRGIPSQPARGVADGSVHRDHDRSMDVDQRACSG